MSDAPETSEPALDAPAPAPPPENSPLPTATVLRPLLTPDRRRWLLAIAVYAVTVGVYALFAGKQRLTQHTPFNHFTHLADAWLHGRQDIVRGGPSYAGGNDFAEFNGKTYISFPPLPALLMLPFVALAGSPERFQDGQFIVWIAGLGPAFLFLVLEKLRRTGRSLRTEAENLVFTALFAFGTVYFFTAVQGTVWFAGHVVGVACISAFLLFAFDAERPLLAGTAIGAAFLTRPTTALVAVLFLVEAIRVSSTADDASDPVRLGPPSLDRLVRLLRRIDAAAFAKRLALFSAPVLVALGIASWMNWTRFHNPSPSAFGHEHLAVFWKQRMATWGLFGYHYLPKNLGVMLTILPWLPPHGKRVLDGAYFKINEHGLALWWTTPLYLWLFAPKKRTSEEGVPYGGWLVGTVLLAAAGPFVMNLFYQNSGWQQFGYRFSNDYAPFLVVALALGNRRQGALFWTALLWAVAWNAFGALSFQRAGFENYYFVDGSQTILYQGD